MVIYQWRELELLSFPPYSLDFANSESEVKNENSIDKIEKLIDSIAYNGIIALVNLTIIISSACWNCSMG